ncbi:hypothetical protein KC19_8G147100 [Ceratodon purpureus]|uniref:Uncharacterized protein n=1 Tax=Ceratodon purpureus TaxID=3225 RepID=A0A8T0H442_CERPU|nr:hypothetical protein KC19_8G147100 [Ceratodon purpureus]
MCSMYDHLMCFQEGRKSTLVTEHELTFKYKNVRICFNIKLVLTTLFDALFKHLPKRLWKNSSRAILHGHPINPTGIQDIMWL